MAEDRVGRIERRAYEIWEREGRPSGREADHWAQAEREILLEEEELEHPPGRVTPAPTGRAEGEPVPGGLPPAGAVDAQPTDADKAREAVARTSRARSGKDGSGGMRTDTTADRTAQPATAAPVRGTERGTEKSFDTRAGADSAASATERAEGESGGRRGRAARTSRRTGTTGTL